MSAIEDAARGRGEEPRLFTFVLIRVVLLVCKFSFGNIILHKIQNLVHPTVSYQIYDTIIALFLSGREASREAVGMRLLLFYF